MQTSAVNNSSDTDQATGTSADGNSSGGSNSSSTASNSEQSASQDVNSTETDGTLTQSNTESTGKDTSVTQMQNADEASGGGAPGDDKQSTSDSVMSEADSGVQGGQVVDAEAVDLGPDATSTTQDAGAPDDGCRTHEECADGYCALPGNWTRGCSGVAPMCPADTCATHDDCADGYCFAYMESLCSGYGIGRCMPACQSDADCYAGLTCTDGHCVDTNRSCELGLECPAQTECVTGQPSFEPGLLNTSCVRLQCSQDADCTDGGYCLNGHCWEQLGICGPMPAPCLAP